MSTKKDKHTKCNEYSSSLFFQIFIIFCIIAHTSIAIFSLINNIIPLFTFNIGSIIVYTTCMFLLKKNMTMIFYISYLEIVAHSFACVILIGTNFGFPLYFIALVPISFNLLHTSNTKNYLKKATLLSIVSFIMYACCYIISINIEPIYSSATLDKARPIVYLINMFVAFFALGLCSVFFSLEIESAFNKLYNKNHELGILANRDPLTGLYNRRTMTEQVMQMYESAKTDNGYFSLILCDIDDFKKINDTYGHDCGDVVLKKISDVLTSLTRGHDYLCRWGGEEFLILLNNLDYDMAKIIAERIRLQISNTNIVYENLTLNITMTFGIACSTQKDDYEALFKLADEHLYEGKKSGKNIVI